MSKIKNFLYRILYALPFGLKDADKEIFGSGGKYSNGQNINQQVSDERVGKHLLKGEVTQSVKELRYRTYKVDDESRKYKYVGNGIAVKKNAKKRNINKISFSQDCKLVTSDVLEELNHVGDYGEENYTLKIKYNNPLVRFKLEQFATQIDVNIDKDNNKFFTTLHFSAIPNGYEKKSAPFINEVKKIINVLNNLKKLDFNREKNDILNNIYRHYEIASSIDVMSFTTYKATNDEPDLIVYTFSEPFLTNADEKNAELLLTFSWDSCESVDLKEKYYDKTMDDKYKTKAPKKVDISITGDEKRVAYCDICGKEISTYDADITKYTFGKAMCKECLEKYLKNLKETNTK